MQLDGFDGWKNIDLILLKLGALELGRQEKEGAMA